MNYSIINSNIPAKLNICCCFKNGCCRDIYIEYDYSGCKKVYADMLRDTFNVQVSFIISLRHSTIIFRIVKAVDNILSISKANNKEDEVLLKSEMLKQEPTLLGIAEEDFENDYDTDQVDGLYDVYDEDKANRKDWSKIVERRGKGPILRENSLNIISNSTVCVFQWNKGRYRCFCCNEPFNEIKTLREHTDKVHNLKNIEKKIITQQNRLVKVEISNLSCKICKKEFFDLAELKVHLLDDHRVLQTIEDLLVPFKIQDGGLKCQICGESFGHFRLLNIHVNKHFQNEVCHICGTGFSNLVFLNLHKTRTHRPLRCSKCDVFFDSKSEKKIHDSKVHSIKCERKSRFPCAYCDERFPQESFRVLHLVEKHGMVKPEFECSFCKKTFVTRSLLNNHVRYVHMKEKNHKCDVCNRLFYNKSDVSRHKVTHTGAKNYNCATCGNNFATKDSLRRHVKRTHSN